MGLSLTALNYIEECVNATMGGLRGKRMLELGNQHITEDHIQEKTGKEYYLNRVVEHVSFDLNGEDGALTVDLSRPVRDSKWHGYFDIITNSGTSEHVGPPKKAQYECFRNIHNCLKVGGVAVHLVPDIDELKNKGFWKGHCNYYYSKRFFEMLAKNNQYELVSFKNLDGLACACLRKQQDMPFMENRKEFLRYIIRKGLPQIDAGINDRGVYRFIYLCRRFVKTIG